MKKATSRRETSTISFQRLAHFLICLSIVLYALYSGRAFFIPITYGIFFALMLQPVCRRFDDLFSSRILSVLLTLFTASAIVIGVIFFFFNQVQAILTEADDIYAGLQETLYEWAEYGGDRFGLTGEEVETYIDQAITSVSSEPLGIVSTGLSTSGVLLANFSLVMIYTFFFLLYRTAVKNFVLGQLSDDDQTEGLQTLNEVQQVAKSYLGGMGLVMLILGILNSLGLFAIGLDYYLVWGFLAAVLGIIPYIGTVIGGMLPFLFAVATTESLWQPILVIVLYVTVQFIEGNLITPKVLGGSVKINALAAIISVIIGSFFWGIAGIILAIPLLAMIRIILTHIEPLRPVALLMSDDLYEQSEQFVTTFNQSKYRISNIFSGRSSLALTPRKRLAGKVKQQVGDTDTEVIADSKPN
ncbi:putative PurR-regulated permease PerM [Lewinella aquimaris]|uniref:Putative PurR-regulated permease PerM n=1 Tax=Neolewinella aquimaris TaxID=1835722 RepID=A0A840DY80_9BACT|nr:AI-2E family transporter [Neolewinella aquimaris]MBB4078194.1 putative PurR-regulated permease PerM [Neolewinella aquimaris]